MNILSNFKWFLCILLVGPLTIGLTTIGIAYSQDDPGYLPTVAESSRFTATATDEQVHQFLETLAGRWEAAELVVLGRTVEGRPIEALIVESETERQSAKVSSVDSAQPLQRQGLTVLIMGGIHPGECDGKEACLALARDLFLSSAKSAIASLRLIFVPNFNADGDARRSPHHRPGQEGPSNGMGIRENAQGLDLNRDFVKLESPEVQCLVAAIHRYDVDVLIDLHTTNGSLHQYDLTYDIPHHPAASPELDRYLRDDLLPRTTRLLDEQGIPTFYYGNFSSDHKRWESFGHEPRYSTEYMGLRGGIGILVESYSYASYQKRFEASYQFVKRVLELLDLDAQTLRRLVDQRKSESAFGTKTAVSAKLSLSAPSVVVRGYQDATGRPASQPFSSESRQALQPHDYSLELWNRGLPIVEVTLPAAYAVDPQMAWAVSRVINHGIPVFRLSTDLNATVEIARIEEVSSQQAYQGHRLKGLKVQWREEQQMLPAGTYIIPSTGSLGRLAAVLLEPESDDSLATWNFLDPYLEVGSDFSIKRLAAMPGTGSLPTGAMQPVSKVEPGEQLSFPLVMKPGGTIDFSGGNRFESIQWLKGSSPSEYAFRKDGQWYAAEAATGATRRIDQQRQLEDALQKLDEFSDGEARSAAARSRFWREGLTRELLEHKGDLFLFDAPSQSVRRLTRSSDRPKELAELSPTAQHVAFVRDNDLWVVDCESAQEVPLTQDGSPQLLNGILDWVYQEELYGRGNFKGFWWSPDGQYIAFLQLDQTEVPEFLVLDSVPVSQSVERIRYPKAGQPNPKVKVILVDVTSRKTQEVDLSSWPVEDRLIGRVSWSPENHVWLQVFNRVQNVQDLVRVDPATGIVQPVLKEQTAGWIEIRGTPLFLKDDRFLWLSDVPNGRTHLYLVDANTGQRQSLTSGHWDVSELLYVAEDEQTAFVSGNLGEVIEDHLVAVSLTNGGYERITQQAGSHRTSLDPSGKYFIDHFSSVESLPVTTLRNLDDRMLRILSAPVSDRYRYAKIQPPILCTIPSRDGLDLQAMVMLPPDVQFSGGVGQKKLPVLFHVYAGPQAPIVQNSWPQRNYWWHQMLCSKGYAVVLCDNRSARGRGVADTWTIRGDMGRVELRDLEDAVDWVSEQSWADSDRIGLWGWSYGGYMTAYALTHSQKFRVGIAGAPVTDWRNYDSIYTERYMDLPEKNATGYQTSSVVEAAKNIHGRLLLIHGERDDNVHLSNTLQLAAALQGAGKQFDMMIYPKARHAVVEPSKRSQMHELMTEFLETHLKGNR